jgi:hypothetical protein
MASMMTADRSTTQSGCGNSQKSGSGHSEQECQEETSNAAKSALAAQRKSKELTQAAAAAGDPEERQKLLKKALEKEIEAESFGKTAKYFQSGSFQGLVAGGGLGTGIGIGLGTLTGTLVGGVASLVTGGLGSAVGAGVGALKGPFVTPGELAGEGVSKVTGTVPGWSATEEQQEALEKMIGDAHGQDRPSEEDLTILSNVKASEAATHTVNDDLKNGREDVKSQGETWAEYASSYVPSSSSLPSSTGWGSKKPIDQEADMEAHREKNSQEQHIYKEGYTQDGEKPEAQNDERPQALDDESTDIPEGKDPADEYSGNARPEARAHANGQQGKQRSSTPKADGAQTPPFQATRRARSQVHHKVAPENHSVRLNNDVSGRKNIRKPRKLSRENKGGTLLLSTNPPKKKPPKLSREDINSAISPISSNPTKKKPRKLEVRS